MAAFTSPIPKKFLEDPETAEWARALTLYLDAINAPEGVLATSTATAEVVLTQQEKLDLMTISQAVDLDSIESQAQAATDAIAEIQSGSPTYTISNDGTVRTLNADDAAGAISPAVTQGEVENIRDAVLVQGDVLATVIRDLKNKGVFGV